MAAKTCLQAESVQEALRHLDLTAWYSDCANPTAKPAATTAEPSPTATRPAPAKPAPAAKPAPVAAKAAPAAKTAKTATTANSAPAAAKSSRAATKPPPTSTEPPAASKPLDLPKGPALYREYGQYRFCDIVKFHNEEGGYYTIKLDGVERQTTRDKLAPVSALPKASPYQAPPQTYKGPLASEINLSEEAELRRLESGASRKARAWGRAIESAPESQPASPSDYYMDDSIWGEDGPPPPETPPPTSPDPPLSGLVDGALAAAADAAIANFTSAAAAAEINVHIADDTTAAAATAAASAAASDAASDAESDTASDATSEAAWDVDAAAAAANTTSNAASAAAASAAADADADADADAASVVEPAAPQISLSEAVQLGLISVGYAEAMLTSRPEACPGCLLCRPRM